MLAFGTRCLPADRANRRRTKSHSSNYVRQNLVVGGTLNRSSIELRLGGLPPEQERRRARNRGRSSSQRSAAASCCWSSAAVVSGNALETLAFTRKRHRESVLKAAHDPCCDAKRRKGAFALRAGRLASSLPWHQLRSARDATLRERSGGLPRDGSGSRRSRS